MPRWPNGWPALGRRTSAILLLTFTAIIAAGVVTAAVTTDLVWLAIAAVVVTMVLQLALSRSSHNLAVRLAAERPVVADVAPAAADAPVAAVFDLKYAPGEPLDLLRRDLQRDVSSLIMLNSLLPAAGRLPPPGGWAATPDTLLALVSSVMKSIGPSTIVECGSGTSTSWLSVALNSVGGGRLISLEHDPEYGAQTRRALESVGIESRADVRVFPLEPRHIDGETFAWFPDEAFSDIPDITLLFVDGPPGYLGPQARFPALPLLASQLADGALVVLDDIDRAEEQEVLVRWLSKSWSGVTLTEETRTDRAVLLRVSR